MSELVDDSQISNDEVLWRRISPEQLHRNADGTHYCSDAAFRTDRMSVHVASQASQPVILESYPQHSLAAFSAGFVRSIDCIVVSDPNDPAHALVCRKDDPTKRLSGSQAKKISKEARLIVVRVGSESV